MKPKNKKWKKIVIFLVIIAIIITGVISCQVSASKKLMETLNQVETAIVERRSITNYVSATGVLCSETDVNMSADLRGVKVKEVFVSVGDYVHKGDIIAEFDTTDLLKQLESAKESLDDVNSLNGLSIAGANRTYNDTVRNGEYSISQAQNEVERAQTNYTYMVADYQTQLNDYQKSVDEENFAVSERDRAKQDYESAQGMEASRRSTFESANQEYQTYITGAEYLTITAEVDQSLNCATIKNWVNSGCYSEKGFSDGTVSYTTDELKQKMSVTGEAIDEDILLGFRYYKVLRKAETLSKNVTEAKTAYDEIVGQISQLNAIYESKEAAVKAATATRENMQKALTTAERQVASAKSSCDTAAKAYENTKATQESAISAARDSVSSTKINANNRSQESSVENYEQQVEKGMLKATNDGTITSVSIKEGNSYDGGGVVTIQDTENLYLSSEIDQSEISNVKEGMEVLVRTDATGKDDLHGVVQSISPVPVQGKSSVKYKVKIKLTEQNERLMIGMTARISIITKSANDVLTVPYDAIYEDDDGNKVLHLYNEDTEEITNLPVTIGLEGDYYVEVSADQLAEGTVIQIPNLEVNDAMQELLMEMGGMGGM